MDARRRRGAVAATLAGLVLLGTPAAATETRPKDVPDRLEDMVDDLMDRMKPALQDLFDLFEMIDRIDSPSNYGKPEILPNGDILIPRAPDAPPWDPNWDEAPDFTPHEPLDEPLPDDGDSART